MLHQDFQKCVWYSEFAITVSNITLRSLITNLDKQGKEILSEAAKLLR